MLQDAFAKVVARPEQAPADEAIVPWFYRTLRNAAVDQFRRRGAADRAHQAFARDLETQERPTREMEAEICACVSRLASTLKPEDAEALLAIEVGGKPVKAFADEKGLSTSNAAVRVLRAREALKKRVIESCGTCAEHGCINCTCRRDQNTEEPVGMWTRTERAPTFHRPYPQGLTNGLSISELWSETRPVGGDARCSTALRASSA
ncbi:MAG: RNA polymerase subunit sigma-70 [Acidobacteria bacterium]|nr:RNA polymerase subunit sigma-70 [Acidobacteriota bacterium]MCA1651045.1 RNA polymerase subunit sigma-70 [Acidobacteriota bacterium]